MGEYTLPKKCPFSETQKKTLVFFSCLPAFKQCCVNGTVFFSPRASRSSSLKVVVVVLVVLVVLLLLVVVVTFCKT